MLFEKSLLYSINMALGTVILFSLQFSVNAQSFEPILNTESTWVQGYTTEYLPSTFQGYGNLIVKGDTSINGVSYQKMYRTPNSPEYSFISANYFTALREEEDGKVYINQNGIESLYLDMSLELGQTIPIYATGNAPGGQPFATVAVKDSVLIGTDWRVRLLVDIAFEDYPTCYSEYWIEGIGNTTGFLRTIYPCYIGGYNSINLICHKTSGELNYIDTDILSCTMPNLLVMNPLSDLTVCLNEEILPTTVLAATNVNPFFFNEDFFYSTGGVSPKISTIISPSGNIIESGVHDGEAGEYTLQIVDALGHMVSGTFNVTVIPETIEPLEILATPFSDECIVDSLLLSASNSYSSYEWTDVFGNVLGNNQDLVVYESQNYYLEVSTPGGCATEDIEALNTGFPLGDFTSIFMGPSFVNIITEPQYPCFGDVVTFSTKGSYPNYEWNVKTYSDDDNYTETIYTTPTFTAIADTLLTQVEVTIIDENGCAGPLINIVDNFNWADTPQPASTPVIVTNGGALFAETTGTVAHYQWFLNGETINGAQSDTYTPTEPGQYMVATSMEFGNLSCPKFSQPFTVGTERTVQLTALLEGPYDSSAGLMAAHLLEANLLPLNQPYNGDPWQYYGAESVSSFPANTVDWILVEARVGTANGITPNTTVIERKAALLLADGTIVAPNGNPLVFQYLWEDAYYFVIRHRNHLDVISATVVTTEEDIIYDFTTGTNQALGAEQLKSMNNGKAALYAADLDPNGVILNTDYDLWTVEPALNQVYDLSDSNLDGLVQTTDYDLWFLNRSKLGVVEIQY